MSDRPEHLDCQNELARIDREWDTERRRYMVTSRYGRQYVPSAAGAVIMGAVAVGVGLVWTVMALDIAAAAPGGFGAVLALFGVVFIAAGAGLSIHQFNKARRYQAAYAAYRRRREEAEDRVSG